VTPLPRQAVSRSTSRHASHGASVLPDIGRRLTIAPSWLGDDDDRHRDICSLHLLIYTQSMVARHSSGVSTIDRRHCILRLRLKDVRRCWARRTSSTSSRRPGRCWLTSAAASVLSSSLRLWRICFAGGAVGSPLPYVHRCPAAERPPPAPSQSSLAMGGRRGCDRVLLYLTFCRSIASLSGSSLHTVLHADGVHSICLLAIGAYLFFCPPVPITEHAKRRYVLPAIDS